MSRFLIGSLGVTVLVVVAALVQLLLSDTVPPFSHPTYAPLDIQIRDADGALVRLARGLGYKTVSSSNRSDHIESRDAFRGLHVHLTEAFPRMHSELQLKKVPCASTSRQEPPVIFTWLADEWSYLRWPTGVCCTNGLVKTHP